MANLWQFFGLPDPEGNSNREAPSTPLRPAPTPVNVEQATLTTVEPAPVMASTTVSTSATVLDTAPTAVKLDWPSYTGWGTIPRPRTPYGTATGASIQSPEVCCTGCHETHSHTANTATRASR